MMNTAPESVQSVFDRTFAGISQAREAFTPQMTTKEVGTVISVATGIAKVSGLPGVGFEELVKFPGDVFGIAFNLDEDEIGVVLLGIAKVSGLPGVGFEELVKFPGDVYGIAFNVDQDEIGVVLLGDYWHLQAGNEVERTGRVMDVAVGDGLLGRVIDPLGRALDGGGPVASNQRLPVERPAAPLTDSS